MTIGAYNPANSQISIVKQAATSRLPTSGWLDIHFDQSGHTLGPEITGIQVTDITAGGQAQPQLASTVNLEGRTLNIGAYPEVHGLLFGALQGALATSTVSGSAKQHRFTPTASTNSYAPFAMRSWTDDGAPLYLLGGYVGQAAFTLTKPNYLRAALNLAFEEYRYWDYATQGTGTSTDPELRGVPKASIAAAADGDVYIKVTDATPGSGYDFKVKVKIGSAATYDGAEINIPVGTWVTLTEENDALIGTYDMPVQGFWANATGIALNDEWTIGRESDKWTQSLPTRDVLNETMATLYLDGAEFSVETVGCTVVRPLDIPNNVGGRFRRGITMAGVRGVTWTLARKQLDRTLVRAIEDGATVGLRLDAYSSREIVSGNSATRPRISLISPACAMLGAFGSVNNANRFDENVTLTAYPSADGTYPSDLTIEVVNSVSSY